MIRMLMVLAAAWFFPTSAAAQCTLPRGAVLRVGCTVGCPPDYVNAVREAARTLGYAVEFATIRPPARGHYERILGAYDAILSPGGHDIDPSYYSLKVPPEMAEQLKEKHRRYGNAGRTSPDFAARDAHESALMKAYFNDDTLKRTPLLGVCYGMQMLAAVHGTPLYVDITADLGIPARRGVRDLITFEGEPGALGPVLNGPFQGFKNHHQAVDLGYIRAHPELYPDLTVRATSNDGKIPEIIEAVGRPAVGIQFHAEISERRVANAVYGWLLTQACEKRRSTPLP